MAAANVRSLKDLQASVTSFFAGGDFFQAYDAAIGGLKKFPGDPWLRHRAVLSLVNVGARSLACRKYIELGLGADASTEARTLGARLIKDIAYSLPDGSDRQSMLEGSVDAYARAFDAARDRGKNNEAYYPGINAATLALFAGQVDRATAFAVAVHTLVSTEIAAVRADGQTPEYWLLATEIEAAVLRDDLDTAIPLVDEAVKACGQNYAQLSATGRQLQRILQVKKRDAAPFSAFIPPPVIHFAGHLMAAPRAPGRFLPADEAGVKAEIERVLDELKPSAGYGSLACGADILFAEALLARNAQIHIVLPFAGAEFIRKSVRQAGATWVARYKACIKHCKTVGSGPPGHQNTLRFATNDLHHTDDRLYFYCSQLAMGLAVMRARSLNTQAYQLAVWDGEASDAVAGTVRDMVTWRKARHPRRIIQCGSRTVTDAIETFEPAPNPPCLRETKAMLFGDFKGFSKLTDEELPLFTKNIMGPLAETLRGFGDAVKLVNTWGDGLFIVFDDAGKAADAALALQEAMERIDLKAAGMPETLGLRIGGHLGPAHEIVDPFLGRANYFGAHVSRAARIEPITPEGCVYVTETFAAVLALHNAAEFTCEYVGLTKMAKKYGQLRMFLLNRSSISAGSLGRIKLVAQPVLDAILAEAPAQG